MASIVPGIDEVEQHHKRPARRPITGTAFTLVSMRRLGDLLPLKVVLVHLGGKAYPLRLQQHIDVRATELEEAELLAPGQFCLVVGSSHGHAGSCALSTVAAPVGGSAE